MSTGVIIAIVVVVLILIALLVLLPRMRAQAAERKREQERREAERRLERERREAADKHRSASDNQLKRAELAEQEAKKQRAEAEIHTKRAELHEEGLADEDLESAGANGRVTPGDRDPRPVSRDERVDEAEGDRVRPVSGGRAHESATEPAGESEGVRYSSDDRETEFDRGFETGRGPEESGTGARQGTRDDEPGRTDDDPDRGQLR